MKKCPFCGADIPYNALVCRFCGERLEAPAQGYGYSAPAKTGSQTLTLVMGILGFFCLPLGIVAIILWANHRSKVKRGLAQPDGAATAGMVLGFVSVVINIIAIIAFVVIWMSMWGMMYESMTAAQLMQIHEAQQRHMQLNGRYAYQLSELSSHGVQDMGQFSSFIGYDFDLTSDGTTWSCVASPARTGDGDNRMRHFYVDQEGVIRVSDTVDIGPESPPYRFPGSPGSGNPFGSDW